MNLVPAIEVDAVPINESTASPSPRPAERIMLENGPSPSTRNAAGSRIQPHGDPFLSDIVAAGANFIRSHEAGAIIHRGPGFNDPRRRSTRVAPRQIAQIVFSDRKVLTRIVRLEIFLADVVDDIVFLLRRHPRLWGHQAKAA